MNQQNADKVNSTPAPGGTEGEVKDLVCGMTVNPATAFGHTEFGGHKYYFCSAHCLEKFKADPQKYVTN